MRTVRVTAPEFDRRAADELADALTAALGERGSATLALSGGSTPWPVLDELVTRDLAWGDVAVWQVDERVAPPGHDDRNLTGIVAHLADRVPVTLRAMPVGDDDLDRAARSYAATLPEAFDVVQLGLGPDGHTASLVPDDPVLDVTDRAVAVAGPYQGRRRLTLTYPVLGRARRLVWLVPDDDKTEVVERLLAGDPSIPAGRVPADRAVLVTV